MLLPQGSPGRLTPAQARVVRDGSALFADVREEGESMVGHAPRAVFWPPPRLAEGAGVPGFGDGPDLVLICRSGNRCQQAAHLLSARGVKAVDVTGGMRVWDAEGLPVRDAHRVAGTVI
ncbi:rhodanese-like domain-containing protein [Streptomyces longwoodensis]|uniref:rhodanese-like domain-containing protein n=1 Tax=Streptomyces longwoodensis TaxID=68231 RepID=UPI0033C3D496